MTTNWEIIGKLKASEHRMNILEALTEAEMTPKEISKNLNAKFSHVSRTLRELKEMELVKLLTSELHVGRIYGITDKGKKMLGSLKKNGK